MKKTIYNIVLLLGTLFLTACGNDEEMPFEKKVPEIKEETTIKEEEKKQNAPESKAYVYSNSVTLALENCGTLKELLGDSLTTADKLVVSGPLDANDVNTFLNEMPALLVLDMTDATFVENSLTFYNKGYSNGTKLSLKENEIVPYMFCHTTLIEIILPKTITSIADKAFYHGYAKTEYLEKVTLQEGVISIGAYAFSHSGKLLSVNLPTTLTTIGNNAFKNCDALALNSLPESLTIIGNSAFEGCDALTLNSLPESLTTIGNRAFYNCENLSSITLPAQLQSIGEEAFYECTKLASVSFSEGLQTIGNAAFRKTALKTLDNLPESLQSIGNNAFRGCSQLVSATFPKMNGVLAEDVISHCPKLTTVKLHPDTKTISNYVFYNCSALQTLDIPAGVTSIGLAAFRGAGLTSITIPEGITAIPNDAFRDCFALQSIVLPEGLTDIGNYAFAGCNALTQIDFLPEGLTSLGEYCFSGCNSLAKVNLPSTMTTIGDHAFSNCDAIKKVDFLPESLTSLGSGVFSGCSALTEAVFPESITEVPSVTFMDCEVLEKVSLPKVTTIGSRAFRNCGLTVVDFLPETLTSLGEEVFGYCKKLTTVKLPNSVTDVGGYLFYYCDALIDVTLSESMTYISDYMFRNCDALPTIKIPDNVSYIGSWAFETCNNLQTVQFPKQLQTIKYYAFHDCTKLSSVTLSSNLTNFESSVFENCYNLQSVNIEEGCTVIGSSSFHNCTRLSEIKLPSTLKTIQSSAFSGCTSINHLDFLPEGLERIEYDAFENCPITANSITFPSTLTFIGDGCFGGNNGFPTKARIASIFLPNTGNITIGNLFNIPSNCLIYSKGSSTETHANLPNVVSNGVCGTLKLVEGSPFHCPEAFTTGKVTFVKQFNKRGSSDNTPTIKGQASNWYGISLPFTVKKITASDGRVFAPFNSDVEDSKPFWLRRLTSNGFENVTSIEANEPYIIAFPNSDSYADEYNVAGDITFTATGNITIPATEDKTVSGEYFSMKTNYGIQPKSSTIYLLNSPRYNNSYNDNLNGVQGKASYNWGSVFLPSLRESWAFEAYAVGGISTSYSIPETLSSRSTRALGSVPQIDDM